MRILTLVGILLLAGTAHAQEIRIVPALNAGDEFRLEITRVRENSARPAQNSRTVTPVDVRVVTAGADGFVLNWVPGESRIESGQAAQDPLVQSAATALRGLQLGLRLNRAGEFDGLTNQAEVVAQLQTATDTIVRAALNASPPEQRGAMQKMMAQVLSPANLVAMVTRDVQTYFNLNGVSLPVGKSSQLDIEHPSPLGGGVIPAKFVVTMKSATADTAVLGTTTAYDGAALLRMTRALVEQGGQKVADAELAKLTMKMSDDGSFVHDRSVGLMREVIVNRRSEVGKDYRLDRWEIRLVRAPRR